MLELGGAVAAAEVEDVGRLARAGLVWDEAGRHLRGHAGEAEGLHVAGAAVEAGADGRHPRALLGQSVAERAVGDEAVPPA